MPKQHIVQEVRPKPTCVGCDICGDCADNKFFALCPDEKYRCVKCFRRFAPVWPTNKKTLIVPSDLVEFYLNKIEGAAAEVGKEDKREGRNVSTRETEIDHAVECALVKMLTGKEPDTTYRKNWNDGGVDGTFSNGKTFDVKTTVVRSNWEGIQGFNSPRKKDGRVVADLLVAALATSDLSRVEAIGWNFREDPTIKLPGFDKPAYPRRGLRDIAILSRRAEELNEKR